MTFIADFHLHSKYSRATSPDMDIETLSKYAEYKGISLLGTGDFTHPLWLRHLQQNLELVEGNLLKHKNTYFILTGEVCTIFLKNGQTRKVHHIIFVPTFNVAEKINSDLKKYGNLSVDGRPILSLEAEKLVEIILIISADCLIIPAHAWTPWFSIFGANYGFDDIEECFGQYSKYIYAIETGLSSDPAMNWRLSKLDKITLISNSDAHSPSKIGREANVFNCPLNYHEIVGAIKTQDRKKILYTIEFFPQEGKYHYDGHRRCNVWWPPLESIKNKNICPVCGQRLTIGVMHRVEELADRKENECPPGMIPFRNLIPLGEIIAQGLGIQSTASPNVDREYLRLINALGNEFKILLEVPREELYRQTTKRIADGIIFVRQGQVEIQPGYDGVYGKINIFPNLERKEPSKEQQMSLF